MSELNRMLNTTLVLFIYYYHETEDYIMKGTKRYYAVWASNGLAVFDNWAGVLSSRKYLRSDKVKKYPTMFEAIHAAISNYNDEHEYSKYPGKQLKPNWIEYTKDFIMQEEI